MPLVQLPVKNCMFVYSIYVCLWSCIECHHAKAEIFCLNIWDFTHSDATLVEMQLFLEFRFLYNLQFDRSCELEDKTLVYLNVVLVIHLKAYFSASLFWLQLKHFIIVSFICSYTVKAMKFCVFISMLEAELWLATQHWRLVSTGN